jgi:protein-S-isoprenylcysteine O-methyltransferase Ste14
LALVTIWLARGIIVLGTIIMILLRRPHEKRSREIAVVKKQRSVVETVLMSLMSIGFILPPLVAVAPVLRFASYPLHPLALAAGTSCVAVALWIFYRSHADLGVNWSTTLEIRAEHELVTQGIYRRIRHPMYLAFLLHAVGETLVLPNWVAGPSYVLAVLLLCGFRLGPEERLMLETFGPDYEAYRACSKRLIPGLL